MPVLEIVPLRMVRALLNFSPDDTQLLYLKSEVALSVLVESNLSEHS